MKVCQYASYKASLLFGKFITDFSELLLISAFHKTWWLLLQVKNKEFHFQSFHHLYLLMRIWDISGIFRFLHISKQLEVFFKKSVFKNFTKFTGKHLCRSLLFKKSLRPAILLKMIMAQVFSCEFCEILKNIFFIENIRVTGSAHSSGDCLMRFGDCIQSLLKSNCGKLLYKISLPYIFLINDDDILINDDDI